MKLKYLILFLLVIFILYSVSAQAQWARLYANAPKHSNFIEITPASSASNTWLDPSIPTQYRSRYNSVSLAYIFTFPLFQKKSAGLGIIIPAAHVLSYNESTSIVNLNTGGMGDISFSFDQNLWGGPSMTKEVFEKTPAQTYSGIHFLFTIPTGKYSVQNENNIGSNRYSLKATYQYTQVWNKGDIQLDFYGGTTFFGDNTQYLDTNTLSEDVLVDVQAHFSYNFTPVAWAEVGAMWSGGGKTYTNGVQRSNSQNNYVGVLGIGTRAWKGCSFFFIYNNTLFYPDNTPDTENMIVQFLQIF